MGLAEGRDTERRDYMIKINRIDHPLIHERAREAFGWTEFGYISASLYFLHKRDDLPSIHDGLSIAGDMVIDFVMSPGQANAFMGGWQHYLAERKMSRTTRSNIARVRHGE